MAILKSQIEFHRASGALMSSGRLNNLFPDTTTTGSTGYRQLIVYNTNESLTLSNAVAWVTQDSRGGQFAIAYDSAGGVQPLNYKYDDAVDVASLTYSAPASFATGIALGHLTPLSKIRLVCRRIVTGSSPATPENNRVWVGGTSPL